MARYGFVSDIHGSLKSLEVALAKLSDATQLFCLGDTVGGPEPSKCLQLLQRKGALSVLGNHDLLEEDLVTLSEEERRGLDALPLFREVDDFVMMHSFFTQESNYKRFHYIRSQEKAKRLFESRSESLIFIGHTHEPAFFEEQASGQIMHKEIKKNFSLVLDETSRYIINVGRASQAVALYEPKRKCVRFRWI